MNDEENVVPVAKEAEKCAEEKVMSLDEWTKKWEEKEIGFHRAEVNERLVKNVDALLHGRENIRLFFPLCGKSVDMKWLADLGHTVVGVEISESGVREFFEEQELKYTTIPVESIKGTLYKSLDGRIRIYVADIFSFSKELEGDFDAIWDRGSLVAINRADRERYSKMILEVMAPDCRYIIIALTYDQKIYSGPPHSTTFEHIVELYGWTCTIDQLEQVDALMEKHRRDWGLDWFTETVFLLTFK